MEDRLLRLKEVLEVIPVSRATWYRGVWAGFYPQPKNMDAHPSGGCPICKSSS